MPRRNKNARTRKQKPYHIMAKYKQKLEVEKKVEQQLAYMQRQDERKQLQEDEESKHNKRLENIGATITLLLVVGLIVMSLSSLWLGR